VVKDRPLKRKENTKKDIGKECNSRAHVLIQFAKTYCGLTIEYWQIHKACGFSHKEASIKQLEQKKEWLDRLIVTARNGEFKKWMLKW
jgi:hypothetical protein